MRKKYFKIPYTPKPDQSEQQVNIKQNGGKGKGNLSVTIGEPFKPERIRNHHGNIKIIDHGDSGSGSGGSGFMDRIQRDRINKLN